MIEPSTGLGIGVGQSRTEIEKSAANELAKTSPQGLSDALERLKKSGKAKDQSTLEAEWVKWAEQEEYDKDHAAEIAEKAEKAKAAALAADRAKWEKLTGEKPDFAPGARNPLDPAYMNPVSVLEDYQKAKANGKGDEYLDYAESKLDEEIAGHKPTIEAIRRIRSGNVGNWQYVGTQGAGGLPRYEKIVRTSDGREIRATIDGDISAYGFVREDNAIKSRIGDAGSLTFQQAREQADRAIDALMRPTEYVAQEDAPQPPGTRVIGSSYFGGTVEKPIYGLFKEGDRVRMKDGGYRGVIADLMTKGNVAESYVVKMDNGTRLTVFASSLIADESAPSGKRYRYGLVNRPASMGAVPNIEYTIEPRPLPGQPHHDIARHGIMVTGRKLTDEEVKAFELAPIADGTTSLAERRWYAALPPRSRQMVASNG
ncbi:MAG: hypothetical protein IPK44_24225 [Candidatus Accumulibacter sp.]|uniref:defense against restriction DarA-related protein n=1 Tax=Accumulibacter sp. TaxID=2053492 RepID=UPI00258A04C5|nr:hypothetical protein [Accumulibacter sp.]MBK8117397.1 hypothetical protein [Accumulibacter sp.]